MIWTFVIGVVLFGISMWLRWHEKRRVMREREQIFDMFFREDEGD